MDDDGDLILRPCMIEFLDPCHYEKQTTEDFFNTCSVKTLMAYGLCAEFAGVYKLIYCYDDTYQEEHDGIVIPKGCVKKITWLEEKFPVTQYVGGQN